MTDFELPEETKTNAVLCLVGYCQERLIASQTLTVSDQATGERWRVSVKKLKSRRGRRRGDGQA